MQVRQAFTFVCNQCEEIRRCGTHHAAAVEQAMHQDRTGHLAVQIVPAHELSRAWWEGRASASTVDRRGRAS